MADLSDGRISMSKCNHDYRYDKRPPVSYCIKCKAFRLTILEQEQADLKYEQRQSLKDLPSTEQEACCKIQNI